MSEEMKIDFRMIRQLRELRGWSQEQLAEAAGLGLRTVQRVESQGRASDETRTCLAAAFNLPYSPPFRRETRPGAVAGALRDRASRSRSSRYGEDLRPSETPQTQYLGVSQ